MLFLLAQLYSQRLWLTLLWNKVFHLRFKLLLTLHRDIYHNLPKYLLTLICFYTVWYFISNSLFTLSCPLMLLILPAAAQFCPVPSLACIEAKAVHIHFEGTLLWFLLLPALLITVYLMSGLHLCILLGFGAPYFFLILSKSFFSCFLSLPLCSSRQPHTCSLTCSLTPSLTHSLTD